MDNTALAEELAHARREIADLHRRLARAEEERSRPLPDTMLLDESFLKRSFAVLGHYVVGSLVIVIPIYIVIFLILVLLGPV